MKKIIHKNPWFSLEKDILPNGVYFFIKKKPGVFIIAKTNKNEVVFVEEYRYPIKKRILQLPAGMVDSGSSLATAKRELYEETGITAKKWQKLGCFYVAPGHENTKIIVYLAKDLRETKQFNKEKNILKIIKLSNSKINNLIKGGQIECGISLASLQLYKNIH